MLRSAENYNRDDLISLLGFHISCFDVRILKLGRRILCIVLCSGGVQLVNQLTWPPTQFIWNISHLWMGFDPHPLCSTLGMPIFDTFYSDWLRSHYMIWLFPLPDRAIIGFELLKINLVGACCSCTRVCQEMEAAFLYRRWTDPWPQISFCIWLMIRSAMSRHTRSIALTGNQSLTRIVFVFWCFHTTHVVGV